MDTKEAETPEAETPEAETPEAETPEAETPEAETPEAETPEAETPEAETPEAETPEAETPEAETPEAETPEEAEELLAQLAESSLFSGLGRGALRRVAGLGTVEQVKYNEFLFREGDEGDKVYLILDGAIRISRQVPGMGEEALAVLRSGSAFGEMVLIDGSPRSADALGHEASTLFVIEKEQLERLMFVDRTLASELLWKMVRILAQRLRATNDKMTFLSVTGRF
ncbi:MAG: cyclic nucleotide-binding domain-containing protein [Deltaproteobacteria bacterium]|nr:cyclic nucleotide-binding domain-containing protein [Deltaproteobacteria bacterium]